MVTTPAKTQHAAVDQLLRHFARLADRRKLEFAVIAAGVAADHALSPLIGPNAAVAIPAVVIFAPFGHPAVRRRFRRHAARARWQARLIRALAPYPPFDDRPPRVLNAETRPSSYRLDLRLQPGTLVDQLEKLAPQLATDLGLGSVSITQNNKNAALARLALVQGAPLSGVTWTWAGDPTQEISIFDPISVGTLEDGEQVTITLVGNNVLAGGEPSSGKSVFIEGIALAAVRSSDCSIVVIDGKTPELDDLIPIAADYAGTDIAEANRVADRLLELMAQRYATLRQLGLKKVSRACGLGLIVVFIDEFPYFALSGKAGKEFSDKIRDIVARGRAAGIVLILTGQKPTADTFPTSIRDLISIRVAFRSSTREASDVILGSGWATAGYSASTIPLADRGVGYLLADAGVPQLFRAFWVPEDVQREAVQAGLARRLQGIKEIVVDVVAEVVPSATEEKGDEDVQ